LAFDRRTKLEREWGVLGAQEAELGEGLRQSTSEQKRDTLLFPNFNQGFHVKGS